MLQQDKTADNDRLWESDGFELDPLVEEWVLPDEHLDPDDEAWTGEAYEPTPEDLTDLDIWLCEVDSREYHEAMALADIADAVYSVRRFMDRDLDSCGLPVG